MQNVLKQQVSHFVARPPNEAVTHSVTKNAKNLEIDKLFLI